MAITNNGGFSRSFGIGASVAQTNRGLDLQQEETNLAAQDLQRKIRENSLATMEKLREGAMVQASEAAHRFQALIASGSPEEAELHRKEHLEAIGIANGAGEILGFAPLTPNAAVNVEAFQAGEKAASEAAGKASVIDVPAEANRMAELAARLVDDGFAGPEIATVLGSMAVNNPELSSIAQTIASAVPDPSQQGTRQGQVDVARAGPAIQALTAAGVDPARATQLVLGRAGVTLGEGTPGGLTGPEKVDIREQIRIIQQARTSLQDVIPLIDEDTVGLMGDLNERFGGITSQVPGLREIQNAIGIFDEESVNKALTARAAFRQAIEFVKPFATRKGSRLSNQDRDFVNQLTAILSQRQTVESARGVTQRLLRIMNQLETSEAQQLESGEISLPQSQSFSQEDLEFTAEKHGISVEEVKRRLGAQ